MGMSLSAFQQEKSGDFIGEQKVWKPLFHLEPRPSERTYIRSIGLHRLRNSWELGEKSPLRDNLCQ